MRILLRHKVKGRPADIMNRFDRQLFLALNPPGIRVFLEDFTGNTTGSEISMRICWGPWYLGYWRSLVVNHRFSEEHCSFTDEGIMLPFPLNYWRHDHIVTRVGEHTYIIDDIHFKCRWKWLNFFLYPVFWLQFFYRRGIYQKHFR
ncbi:MAG: hypothetical protein IBJ09_03425 [Bacteroidia bacterium]|nr:hypothetical protein [Bacteroidia bacterium]